MRFIMYCLAVSVASVVLGGGRHVEGLPIDANPEDYALMNFIRNGRELVRMILLMEKELQQLSRFFLTHQNVINTNNKRNSELINSLLGLPKNINNIGK